MRQEFNSLANASATSPSIGAKWDIGDSITIRANCYPSRKCEPTLSALKTAVENINLDIEVRTSGCLQVCKLGPVAFYSDDKTWYTRVTPETAEKIVKQHLLGGEKVVSNLYPPIE